MRNCDGGGVQPVQVQAVYFDDQISGWEVHNNSFIDCQVAVAAGGGRDNHFTNNYYEACDLAHNFDARGMSKPGANAECNCTCGTTGCAPFPDSGGGCLPGAVSYVLAAPSGTRWASRFPRLARATTERPCVPVDNSLVDNQYCGCKRFVHVWGGTFSEWNSTIARNAELAPPCIHEHSRARA